jgi:hypothetical protein
LAGQIRVDADHACGPHADQGITMELLPDLTVGPEAELDEPEAVQVGENATPLQFLCAVYRNAGLPLHTRLRAATAAAPFVHPKFSVVVGPNDPRAFADQLEERLRRLKLIEAAPGSVRRI